jgi:peptidoglycan/LPS O-acetylase OafA/YrhL
VNPTLSIWLELSRVIAALVVFIGHSAGLGVAPSGIALQWHRTADDAVTAFFVISGLVIAYTTQVSNGTARQYALARMSRVYSVALTTVLFALAVDHVGMRINVSEYVPDWQYPRLWLYLPLHWLFLGETWFGAIYPFTMAPYWSLGYEVWYYVLFGCVVFLRGRTRWAVVAVVLLVMGPRIWLLLPTWWLGVWLYRRLDVLRVGRPVALGLMALSVAAYAVYLGSGLRGVTDELSQQFYAWLSSVLPRPFFRGSTVHVFSDYVMAVLFSVFLVGAASSGLAFGPRASAFIRKVAGYTFTFYMIHYTLLTFALALGHRQTGWGAYAVILAATLLTSWALAQVGEQRRNRYRALFAKVLDTLPGRSATRG